MFPAPIFLVLFAHLFNSSYLQAGIEELTVLVSPDGKQQVILAGDIHDRHPGTQTERLAAAIAECQKQDPSPFEVYIEKPASLFTMFDPSPRITTDLEPALQALNAPGVRVEDCEVRNVAVLAFWLFSDSFSSLGKGSIETGNGKSCSIETATLADLDIEFEKLHISLAAYAKSLSTEVHKNFDHELEIAKNQMNGFRRRIAPYSSHSRTILEASKRLVEYDQANPLRYERKRIQSAVFQPFSQLFNLNIIRYILRSNCNKKLIVAGLRHTQAIKQFFSNIPSLLEPKTPQQNFQSIEKITLLTINLPSNEE